MNNYMKNEKKQGKKLMIAGIVIILILVSLLIIFKGGEGKKIEIQPSPTPVLLNDDGSSLEGEAKAAEREEILKELEAQQLVVTDKLSSNISFPLGTTGSIGEWVVENPEHNTVIMQAEVYLGDLLIAKSTPIYPNQHITGIELLQNVESGEYEVTAYLNYYDTETKEFISKAGYRIHLSVN